jgi:hypothetical protein
MLLVANTIKMTEQTIKETFKATFDINSLLIQMSAKIRFVLFRAALRDPCASAAELAA